jgi:hypothetical protein
MTKNSIKPGLFQMHMVSSQQGAEKNRPHAANIEDVLTLSKHSPESGAISAGEMSMWNSKKYVTLAVLSVGLGVAAAAPASACGGFGYAGWPAAYGYAGGYGLGGWGMGGCGAYGLAGWGGGWGGWGGGWPAYGYAGFGGWPSYGLGGWGGGWGGWGGGYYGAGYGLGGYGWGCRSRHHRASYGGYTVASLPRHYHSNYAVAYARSHHNHTLYASVRGMKQRHFAFAKRNVRFG